MGDGIYIICMYIIYVLSKELCQTWECILSPSPVPQYVQVMSYAGLVVVLHVSLNAALPTCRHTSMAWHPQSSSRPSQNSKRNMLPNITCTYTHCCMA